MATANEKNAGKTELEFATPGSRQVAPPAAAPAAEVALERLDVAVPKRRKPKALLVVHGMGQQLRFETLDAVVNGLFKEEVRKAGSPPQRTPLATHVKLGEERLERIEVGLREKEGAPVQEVHIYEAYWSPLTEGAINLRDVVAFLYRAGLNGLKNALGRFSHWTFGALRVQRVPVQTLVFLVVALLVVAALVAINTVIVAVSAARAAFSDMPKWLSAGLFQDLTAIFNALVIVLLAFGLLIFVSKTANRFRAWTWLKWLLGLASLAAFAASLFAILAAGVAVPMLVTLHGSAPDPATLIVPEYVQEVGRWTPWIVIAAAALLALGVVVSFLSSLVLGWFRQFGAHWKPGRFVASTIVIGVFVWMLVKLGGFAWDLWNNARGPANETTRSVMFQAPVWFAVIGVGVFVRGFLVQFVGDVAAYIESHTIDKFDSLRAKIKERVWKTAKAIYAQKSDGTTFDYDEVVIAGHSLGSVVSYDTLNRLLLDDTTGGGLDVMNRTPLLLTFGSPLDKTAFVFANQKSGKRLTKAREGLAAVVQPMIDSQAVRERIRWLNVYSPWDIISGSLDYYDNPDWPDTNQPPRVVNEVDPEAVTLLAAHVEYWRNWHVFERLHSALA